MQDFLKELNIEPINAGTCTGAGGWSKTDDCGTLNSINPSDGSTIASVHLGSDEDYERLISNAEKTFSEWRQVPAPKRGELVRLMGQALRDKKDALGSLVALEMGKIKAEGDGEVQEMIDMADFAVGQSRMLYGKTMHSERPDHRMYEQWHPMGLVGVISAFNFPVAVWAWNAFISAISGNVVIWKPSSKVPLCAIAVQKICNQVLEANGYPGIFSLFIPKNRTLGEKLVTDKRVPLISFTGSSAVGRHVGELVARRMGRSILELGGNNAIIVDETANLDLAIPAIVFGAVGTAGQRCTSTRRILAHASIIDSLTERLRNAYQQVSVGDPLDANSLMGPLIDESAIEGYQQALNEIRTAGGEILFGGNRIVRSGYFVEPALVRAENSWDTVQRETFAPILYLISFETLDEAISLQNSVVQGLSSALFTNNLQNAERYLSSIGSDCGIANINIGTSGAEIGGAFGGEKETGGGREAGSDSWKAYMRRQTTTINWGSDLPLAQGIKFDLGS